jgi:anthranilate synthase component 1
MRIQPLPPEADLAGLAARFPERYPHFLDSALSGQAPSRFSILFAFPGETLTGAQAVLELLRNLGSMPWEADQEMGRGLIPAGELPFLGGWFFYLGYELAWTLEPSLGQCNRDEDLPEALATYFPAALIRDHRNGQTFFVDELEDPHRWRQVIADVSDAPSLIPPELALLPDFEMMEADPEDYRQAVRQALDYIRDGDCFQANLSREWRIRTRQQWNPEHLYARLRAANPAPFSAWLRFPNVQILSSSPERLVHVRNRVIETRPIAGTRRRDDDALIDMDLRQELHVNSKEVAEHVMLVDLERNDLGRIAKSGSVRVDRLMQLESYRRVHHTVSIITAHLRDDVTARDIIQAVFPGGTITGCPKIRSMQIIQTLEGGAVRGAYTGSCGFISKHGVMDSNILIRTWVLRQQELRFRTGAGIVSDSDPQAELEETRHKARALLEALA